MDEKFRLSDDKLEDIVGGVEMIKKYAAKKIAQRVQLICPRCGRKINQVFYTDGSMKYTECPTCHNPLGEG